MPTRLYVCNTLLERLAGLFNDVTLARFERAFGDVHHKYTRNHNRKRLGNLVRDGERYLFQMGPWRYKLLQLYEAPEVTAAVMCIASGQQTKIAT
jgi:hypothetical protein